MGFQQIVNIKCSTQNGGRVLDTFNLLVKLTFELYCYQLIALHTLFCETHKPHTGKYRGIQYNTIYHFYPLTKGGGGALSKPSAHFYIKKKLFSFYLVCF